MLKPRKITFYQMMLAGYLSAKAYRALKPKTQIGELSFSDCFGFKPIIQNELKKFFENDFLIERLYFLENITNSINLEWDNIHNLYLMCISDLDQHQHSVINTIGEKTFLMDYVFCSDACFKRLNYIDDSNYDALYQVRRKFEEVYKRYIKTGALPDLLNTNATQAKAYTDILPNDVLPSNEPFGSYAIASGRGFSYNDDFVIDDDALGINYKDCKKYVLYLYSLNSEQFEKFEDFLSIAISSCPVRLSNAIKYTGYRNFYVNFLFADDIKYFQIRHFGRKSLFDFNLVKQQVINFVINEYNNANPEKIEEKIREEEKIKIYNSLTLKEKLGELKYAILTDKLKTLMINVSVRTKNRIINYKGDFLEDFVDKSNDVKSIEQIGKKSEKEFYFIISKLRETLCSFNERECTEEDIFWMNKSLVYGSLIDDFCHTYYTINGHLPMFHILANCISTLRNNKQIMVLDGIVSLFSDDERSAVHDVAKKNKITNERVRQICIKVVHDLSEPSKSDTSYISLYHKVISQEEDWAYVIQFISNKKFWEIEELANLLKDEDCSLKKEFIFIALSALLSGKYAIIGKKPLSSKPHGSVNKGWSNTYLISKNIIDCFDFDVMIDLVNDYEKTHTESITLPVQQLLVDILNGAWKQYDFYIEKDLEYIVGQILINELNIIPDYDFNYTLVGRKKEEPADIIYNLLKESGNPIDLYELYSKLKLVFPDKYHTAESLRPVVYKDPRLCFLGVLCMVTLTEWEHVKIGTIRDLIVSFLAEYDSPQHIKDIVKYIQKHRDTSERSISSTMSSGNQFAKFGGGYYGLADKTYSEWVPLSEIECSSWKRIVDFEEFIKANHHFPFCTSDDKEEIYLYQWWSRIKKNKGVSERLKQEIDRIESTYANLVKSKSDLKWLELCQRYSTFVLNNRRKPSNRNSKEAELATWFSKAFNDVAEGKLSPLCKSEFIKLCKSL